MQSFVFILRLILFFCTILTTQTLAKMVTETPSALSRFRNVVLTRRSRAIIFPNNAFVLLSPAFTKAVISGRPTGVSYSIEFDMYSNLPDTIEGWQPTLLINKANRENGNQQQEVEVNTTTNSPKIHHIGDVEDFGYYNDDDWNVDIDTPFWPSDTDERYALPPEVWQSFVETAPDEMAKQEHWRRTHDFNGRKELQNFYKRYRRNMANTSSKADTRDSDTLARFQKLSKSNQTNRFNYNRKWSMKPTDKYILKNKVRNKYKYAENLNRQYSQNYRERREIFDQLNMVGKIFNFNMTACIQRAMCEMATYLRPKGDSLMEDLLRIILTVPRSADIEDDNYSQTAKKNGTCAQHFMFSCPYAVMDFLTKSIRQKA